MITLESIKEAVAATEKEGNEGWRAMQRLDRRSVEYIKWLIERVEHLEKVISIKNENTDLHIKRILELQKEVEKLKARLKSVRTSQTNYQIGYEKFCEEEDKCHPIIKDISEGIKRLQSDLAKYKKLEDALKKLKVTKETVCHGHGDYGEEISIKLSGYDGLKEGAKELIEFIKEIGEAR